MRTRTPHIAAAVAALALVVSACGDDGNDDAAEAAEATADQESGAAGDSAGTIVDVAASTDGFSTLVAAVQAAGLVDTLHREGPFTVFAPTDDAFAAALDGLGITAEELLADTETLTSILTYHVIADEVPSSTVVTLDGAEVETVNGASVTISVDGDAVMVDAANVTAVDVEADNGVIHVIDAVLLPPAG